MIKLSDLKNLNIYRNKKITLISSSNKNIQMDNMVILFSEDINDLQYLYKTNVLLTRTFRAVYTPKKVVVQGKKTYIRNLNDEYKAITTKFPKLSIFKTMLSGYNHRNLIYDFSANLSALFIKDRIVMNTVKLSNLKSYLDEIISNEDVKLYDKTIYIPITKALDINTVKLLNSANPINPISLLFKLIKNGGLDEKLYNNTTFLIHDTITNKFFKFKIVDDKKYINELRSKLILLLKLSSNIKLDIEETNELQKDELEDKTIDKMIAAIEVNEITPIGGLVSSSFIIESRKELLVNRIIDNIKSRISTNKFKLKQNEVDNIYSAIHKNFQFINSDIIESDDDSYDEDKVADELLLVLDKDTEFKDYLSNLKNKDNNSEIIDKRNQRLKDEQSKLTINDKSLDDILFEFESEEITLDPINVKNIENSSLEISSLKDFDSSYSKNQRLKDILSIFTELNTDKDIQLWITNIEHENTSDSFNKKETWKVTYHDSLGKQHLFKIDIPLLIDDRFAYLRGGKKSIGKQLTRLPVTKIKQDTVEITTNYNKMIIERHGKLVNSNLTKFKKWLLKENNTYNGKTIINKTGFTYKLGDSILINSKFENTLEYDELSTFLMELHTNSADFIFNRKTMETQITLLNITETFSNNTFPIGYLNDENHTLILLNKDTNIITISKKVFELSILECMLENITIQLKSDSFIKEINKEKAGKRFIYSRLLIAGKYFPIAILLGYYNGLYDVLQRYNIEYQISETLLPNLSNLEWNNIKFKNAYLYYKSKPTRNELLLNGLVEANTTEYDIEEFNKKDVYLDYFYYKEGSRNIAKGLDNTLSLMIDGITKNILKSMKLPLNITDLILYANTLLENTAYKARNNTENYRIRGSEQVNDELAKIVASAFKEFKDAVRNGKKDASFSVPQDRLITQFMKNLNVDEYSILNPVLESEKLGTVSVRGISGTNKEDAFKDVATRAYHESMLGVIGLNTPDSNKVGIVRQLTYNMDVTNDYGVISHQLDNDDLNAGNMLTMSELLSPFTSQNASAPRQGMKFMRSLKLKNI